MMRSLTFVFISVLFAAYAGCSSDSGSSGTSPGTGTGTLRVEAHIEAEEAFDNASDPGDFSVEFRVDVYRGTVPVTDAVVRVTPSGQEALELTHDGTEPGRYAGDRTGYARTYTLDVTAGEDNIRGARVRGPAVHVIANPEAGGVVVPGEDVEVRWSRDGADEASVETEHMDETSVPDTGSFTVSGVYFEGNQNEMLGDLVTVKRTNRVEPDGGTSGSHFRVTVRNRIQFYVDVLP